ncbi:glycosyltransferase involved in cell wall biosynthesis [Pseudomonas duriflava]|uniref:Glycosyltransferase involved in cell wall biosynthesis n=1 Tax=Pseudomonas duriflava TaxID=459528 RepID=A0A562PXX5_9PSED|nr:glycosyltransferase [Pseudomonas duriflava]TWI49285.1 glycosyltransferase involved in cell wall biosynthesis [Pseudomonas duriflava]
MFRKILYVSWTSRNERPYEDPSVRYRCFNFAGELVKRGHTAQVISQLNFEKNYECLDGYDAYVFHRPYLTEKFVEILLDLKAKGKVINADFDDFIFDVKYADLTPMVRVRGADSNGVKAYISRTFEAASLINKFTLSTSPLKKHVEELFPDSSSIVLSNTIDRGFLGVSRIARNLNPYELRDFEFGYFSGTATHDKDFELIAPVICEKLKSSGGKILILGPLKVPEVFNNIADSVVTNPIVPFHELPAYMAKCKTVLAPLEDTVFTRSKSGLKFFEAALAGCRVIATPIPDVARFESSLLTCCLNLDEWSVAVNSVLSMNHREHEKEILKIEKEVAISYQVDKFVDYCFGDI